MRKSTIFLILIILVGCSFHEEYPTAQKQVYKTSVEVVKELNQLYQLYAVGIKERAGKEYYTLIGLEFYLYQGLSKNEGRKILIESTRIFLDKINSNVELQPYLQPYPFTEKNVEIAVFTFDEGGKQPYYPEICIFACNEGIITYSTKIPEKKYGYFTEEQETFEEALTIVNSQQSNLK